ncbi:MFS transporter [Kingella negevensis]|uniref:Lysophospholipid transporter LplT n=1 Tax=Kingella negevensis TaxID=1522312 RepID=A0A238TD64_9NEIS|nr:MFS transporter [Kingella negevensis]MDK4680632.1 MFS transporter [Kingella negevensis]MDK4681645.1 MFS transporter [Kingella negevensis]MDK4683728.1 MFS transporter [Kingella negevensis]MDK4689843.1 MFS transporter [Kingella negevensis]MDK4692813.1 MFS transporter [Kingella negevensis]
MNSDFEFAKTRRFAPLFCTQFLGAFNDNLFKTTLFVLISFYGLGKNEVLPAAQMLNVGALLFVLPYFLFSALSGQLSTRYDKAKIAKSVKILEVLIMVLADYGFFASCTPILMLCLFLMGTHSTLFGPVKYAILPEYLQEKELLMGNGLIESGTFLAILFGQILGTSIAGHNPWVLSGMVLLVAVLGLVSSLFMPATPAKTPNSHIDWHIGCNTKNLMKQTKKQPELYTAVIGISWFWFVGSVYTTQLSTFVQKHLNGNASVFNLMLSLFSIGIAAGSVLCAKISKGQLRLKLVTLGAIGLTIFGGLLVFFAHSKHYDGNSLQGLISFLSQSTAYPVIIAMLGIGFFGGFFSVPLYTWLQTAADDEFRAHAIAANNIMNAVFMVSAAIISVILLAMFDSILLLYGVVALGNISLLIYLGKRAPQLFFSK